jgi:hypothetical protein
MEKYTVFWVVIALIIVGGLGFYFFYNPYAAPPGKYDNLAKCLTANGAIMYGQAGCHACAYQMELLGDSSFINEIDCANQIDLCRNQGIMATPTWLINGTLHVGVQSPDELSNFSGCAI